MPVKMRHQEQAARIGLIVLGVVAAAGIIATAAVAPGALLALKPFARKPAWRQRGEVDRALRRLMRRGLVEETRRGRVVGFSLTDKGRTYLMRRELSHAEIVEPKKWDGKWRIVTFDVPEKRRHLRDSLRTHFQRLGLYPIQKSVWLFPYPCDDLVRLIKVDLDLGRSVQYFTVGKFEDREEEKDWRIRFDV
ncbi:MAG: hypothetical protein Q7R80_02135 [bacterium]|nr:hypothetical protein [bacterium]